MNEQTALILADLKRNQGEQISFIIIIIIIIIIVVVVVVVVNYYCCCLQFKYYEYYPFKYLCFL